VIDWSDYLEEGRRVSTDQSRMRMYIAAALIGMGTHDVIGGMLPILPA
jgi:hypothetical protein